MASRRRVSATPLTISNTAYTGRADGIFSTNDQTKLKQAGTWPTAIKSPSAPIIGTTTAGNKQASVAFTAPSTLNGETVTSYTVTSSPGGQTASGASSPVVVTGLSDGVTYTFTVVANSASGPSIASSSASATMFDIPGAPTSVTATATAYNAATVAYTAPANNGGAVITSYTATSSPGGITGTLTQAGSGTITVSGLLAGTAYTFTVKSTNVIGTSSSSAASNSITTLTIAPGEQVYPTPGTYSWIAPANVPSVCMVGIGGGGAGGVGGAGGGLGYRNNIAVTPGTVYTVTVGAGGSAADGHPGNPGGNSTLVVDGIAYGATGAAGTYTAGAPLSGCSGGTGGSQPGYYKGGGGGAGGWTGNGGYAAFPHPQANVFALARPGEGGGGGGGAQLTPDTQGGAGGGASLYGGNGGKGGHSGNNGQQQGGDGGVGPLPGNTAGTAASGWWGAGQYGGGGAGGINGCAGTGGGVRIIWGSGRAFPATGL